jgi:hypothetical protein
MSASEVNLAISFVVFRQMHLIPKSPAALVLKARLPSSVPAPGLSVKVVRPHPSTNSIALAISNAEGQESPRGWPVSPSKCRGASLFDSLPYHIPTRAHCGLSPAWKLAEDLALILALLLEVGIAVT